MSTSKTDGFSGDLSFDAASVQDGASVFGTPKRNAMQRVAKQNPRSSDQNVNAPPTPGASGKPTFGPDGPGAAFKTSGFDRETGPETNGQRS